MGLVSVTVRALSLYLPPNVFWIMLFIGTVFASSWGPVAFMSVWSRRITADAAFWGMLVGLLANVVPAGLDYLGAIALPSYLDPALLGTAAGLLTIVVISRGQRPSTAEQDYLARLHETPAEDRDLGRTRLTLLAPALLVLYGLCMPAFLLHFYVKPFQRGAGTILDSGALNWQEAEPWIAFGPAVLFVPLGLIAGVTIWRRYRPGTATGVNPPGT
jgi:sodium/pantothenate symporter